MTAKIIYVVLSLYAAMFIFTVATTPVTYHVRWIQFATEIVKFITIAR